MLWPTLAGPRRGHPLNEPRVVAAVTNLAAVHHHRIGIVILALLVLAVLVFVGVRLIDRRRAAGRNHGAPPDVGPGASGAVPAAPDSPERPIRAGVPDAGASSAPDSHDERGPRPAAAQPDGPERFGASGSPPNAPRIRTQVGAQGLSDGFAVETHGLTKRFGSNLAVNGVELLVPRGCAFGYLGPNGAGKTTLIRMLLGLTRPDGGSMSLLGIPVPAERSRALAKVGAIVDEPRFYGHLSGDQNLRLLAAARGQGAEERIGPSLARVGLTARADDRVASYSMGMRQRLGVAACLIGDPELLILDEPMNGLDPAGIHEMRSMIDSLVAEGRTVVLSSHLLDEVERTCDAVAIVDRGRVIRQGPIHDLVRAANVVVQVQCSDPPSAARIVNEAGIATDVVVDQSGLSVTLSAGAGRDTVAEVNRRLVEGGIAVYRLQEVRASLEDWFLSVTSRLGENR